MSIRRPLDTLTTIHPEHIASVAREANSRGRFFMAFDGSVERNVEGWGPYESRRHAWPDPRITGRAFDPGFRIVLGATRSCRIFGLTTRLVRETPGAPVEWLERCTVRADRAVDVRLDAEGARDDLAAWWWLCVHAAPVIACDARVLDASTLFTIGDGVHFATTRFISRPVIDHAKRAASDAGVVALAPGASDHGWGVLVVGSAPVIGELAAEGVRRFPAEEKQVHVHATLETCILSAMESATFWTGTISPASFEQVIVAALRRGEKHPEHPRDAIRALAAAEGVAIAEGRGPADAGDDGMAGLVAGFAREHAERADPLRDDTLALALRAVERVLDAGSWERREYVSEEGRAEFRAELAGLRKRLLAAQSTRRVRATAPNAVRVPAMRHVPIVPTHWRELGLYTTLDDAVALLHVLREHTGAVTSIPMSDLTLRSLENDWTTREALATIMDEPFDARTGEWGRLRTGVPVFVWWPDVSSAPTIRSAIDGWESVGWGFAQLTLRGGTRERVLPSLWQHPTGTELREPKFGTPGPWREVDWRQLRRKVTAVKELLHGALGGVAPIDVHDTYVLANAVRDVRAGRRVLDRAGLSGVLVLPP